MLSNVNTVLYKFVFRSCSLYQSGMCWQIVKCICISLLCPGFKFHIDLCEMDNLLSSCVIIKKRLSGCWMSVVIMVVLQLQCITTQGHLSED